MWGKEPACRLFFIFTFIIKSETVNDIKSSLMELLSSVKYNIKDPELYCGGTMAMECMTPL